MYSIANILDWKERYFFYSRTVYALFALLFLSCCHTYDLEEWPINYPPEVEAPVNLFIDYAPEWVEAKPLTIVLTNELRSNGRKVCGLSSHRMNKILLDTTSHAWKYSKQTLVLHELGHYVLKREHTHDTTTIYDTWKGFPISLMHYSVSKPSDWNLSNDELLNYYLDELFFPQWPDNG